ncbi:MAG: class I adenylate-forming enzyme family protein [Leucobacter sp.]
MLTGDIIRRSAERFPKKSAIIWNDQKTTFEELDLEANRFAQALTASGLRKGDHIAIVCRNRTEYAIAFFGSAKAGTVLVNISVQYTSDQFAYSLDKADVKCLFVEDSLLDVTAKARDAIAHNVVIGVESGSDDGVVSFTDFLARAGSAEDPMVNIHEDDPFCMTFTGGTTGMPKGVLASHRNRITTAHTVAFEEGLEDTDVVAIVTPLFHVAALNIMFQPAMLVGASCVFQTKWNVAEFVNSVKTHGITAGFMVPTQAQMLVSDEDVDFADMSSFRKVSFAGAPMPDWTQRELMEKLPNLRITQIYGQSEVGVVCSLPHRFLPEKLGSVGRQAYNVEIAILDENGAHVETGQIGELCSRGDNVMLEYYNDATETQKFFRGGWGWTGDLAKMDEDGFIFLVDRSKDMLISGGENVYPKEIENAIQLHAAVAECAVIGVPDEKWGEAPVAYVIPRKGQSVSADELLEECRQTLTKFKVPHLVLVVDELPMTAMGKVQKHVLRAQYREQFGGMAPLLIGQGQADGPRQAWGSDA